MSQHVPSAENRRLQAFDSTLCGLFDGGLTSAEARQAKIGMTATLVSVGSDNWPISALLGPAEVLITAPSVMILALWPSSRVCRGLDETGRASLQIVADQSYYQLKLAVLRCSMRNGLLMFEVTLTDGEAQRVPYATLTSGIRYTLANPEETTQRWCEQVAAMRKFAEDGAGAAGTAGQEGRG